MSATPKINPRGIILVPIRADSLLAYEAATKLLQQKLGSDAPDLMMLVNYQLSYRDARGISDDYLDSYDHERERMVFRIHMQSKPKGGMPMSKDLRTARIVAKVGRGKTLVNESWLLRRIPKQSGNATVPMDLSRN